MAPLLELEIDQKTFPAAGAAPARRVIEGVRLVLEPSERVALLGPSGGGKTTLLNLVAGLDGDYAGRLGTADPCRIGYVFQEPRLLPWRTVRDNLRLVVGDAGHEAVDRLIAEVGLEDAASSYASRLSLGMARRAAIARALVIEPELLVLDEPFVSLDPATALRLRLLLLDALDCRHTAMLFVTHELGEAVMLAERVIVLAGQPGRIRGTFEVALTAAERRNPDRVDAQRRALLPGIAAAMGETAG
jgi:ABC-type nitrate/sulfonate/bicarbonate transport system ATPase subunit